MVDDIEDVYKELEAELDNMDLNDIESTVIKLKNNQFCFLPSIIIVVSMIVNMSCYIFQGVNIDAELSEDDDDDYD